MKNVFRTLLLVGCFLLPTQGYSSSSESDTEIFASYRFKTKADFGAQVAKAFRNPNTVSVDFSRVPLTDEELNTVVLPSIQQRSLLTEFQKLDLINLGEGQPEGISRKGFVSFLAALQKIAQEGQEKIYSVLSGVILKTGLTLSEEFVEEIQDAAPFLIARKLKIIE